jgi:hypothetical protein
MLRYSDDRCTMGARTEPRRPNAWLSSIIAGGITTDSGSAVIMKKRERERESNPSFSIAVPQGDALRPRNWWDRALMFVI